MTMVRDRIEHERTHTGAGAMLRRCLITVPALRVSTDCRTVHDRLLDEFPQLTDVLTTTIKESILVVHEQAAPRTPAGGSIRSARRSFTARRRRSKPRRVLETRRGQCPKTPTAILRGHAPGRAP